MNSSKTEVCKLFLFLPNQNKAEVKFSTSDVAECPHHNFTRSAYFKIFRGPFVASTRQLVWLYMRLMSWSLHSDKTRRCWRERSENKRTTKPNVPPMTRPSRTWAPRIFCSNLAPSVLRCLSFHVSWVKVDVQSSDRVYKKEAADALSPARVAVT